MLKKQFRRKQIKWLLIRKFKLITFFLCSFTDLLELGFSNSLWITWWWHENENDSHDLFDLWCSSFQHFVFFVSFFGFVQLRRNCIMYYTINNLGNAGLFFANRYFLIMKGMRCWDVCWFRSLAKQSTKK